MVGFRSTVMLSGNLFYYKLLADMYWIIPYGCKEFIPLVPIINRESVS